jgi:hypothetical protein
MSLASKVLVNQMLVCRIQVLESRLGTHTKIGIQSLICKLVNNVFVTVTVKYVNCGNYALEKEPLCQVLLCLSNGASPPPALHHYNSSLKLLYSMAVLSLEYNHSRQSCNIPSSPATFVNKNNDA